MSVLTKNLSCQTNIYVDWLFYQHIIRNGIFVLFMSIWTLNELLNLFLFVNYR